MNPVDATLFQVIVVMAVVCAVAWAAMGTAMRLSAQASISFAVGNLLLAVGLMLTSLRTAEPAYVYYHVADTLSLLGLALLHRAIRRLVHADLPHPLLAGLPVLLALAITLPFPPSPSSFTVMALAFSGTAAWYAFSSFMDCYRGLDAGVFNRFSRLAISGPLFLLGVMMSVRAGRVVVRAAFELGTVPANPNPVAFLWGALVLLVFVNIAMSGLAAGRLVMRIRALADMDHLTGCLNRRSLDLRLKIELSRNRRNSSGLACVFFDLDHFKQINDTHGHEVGDAALRHAARVIGLLLREVDVLGRYGGEEFIVLMPDTNLQGARDAANRMRLVLERTPLKIDGLEIELTASFGAAVVLPDENQDSFLARADAAMYEAKRLGRNRVEVNSLTP